MKKVLSFLRSMRFGMVLLALIAVLSVFGTLIAQGQSAAYYAHACPGWDGVILALGLDHVYSTWYYVALFAALCLNLLLCSVLRAGRLRTARAGLIARAQKAGPVAGLDADQAAAALKRLGFREQDGVYTRRMLGVFGPLVTHTGLLLLMIAAACAFSLAQKQDAWLMVGDSLTLADGAKIRVESFSMEDASGRLEYTSVLELTGADGTSRTATIQVNHPARLGAHTVYQQSYAFAGVLDVQTAPDAPAEQVVLDSPAFISLDGANGIQYQQVYGDYTVTEDGQIMPVNTAGGVMVHPAYLTAVIADGEQRLGAVLPDETFEVGSVYYTFREPAAYPGLRIKTQPGWVLPLLYASFVVLIAGLYLCFFHVPAAVCVTQDGVRIASGKDTQGLAEGLMDAIHDMAEQ